MKFLIYIFNYCDYFFLHLFERKIFRILPEGDSQLQQNYFLINLYKSLYFLYIITANDYIKLYFNKK